MIIPFIFNSSRYLCRPAVVGVDFLQRFGVEFVELVKVVDGRVFVTVWVAFDSW